MNRSAADPPEPAHPDHPIMAESGLGIEEDPRMRGTEQRLMLWEKSPQPAGVESFPNQRAPASAYRGEA